ncbi:MerR family DNA-binding transcriptional regulator, partial [Alteromonadaceae bacterium A_SAG6]|nr:MerR family DNA-binding transcriptional regulator [Alteromonadaceae bacterium A_SAG6]
RFYEEQGLMSPSRTGQNRVYLNKDRVRLKLILRGKRLGFSLAEVKTLFDMYDTNPNSAIQLEAMLEMTEQKRAVLKQQLEDIQMLMTELDDVEARCREELAELKRGNIA